MDYQYHLDAEYSYSFKPGVSGLFDNTDTLNIFLFAGFNYRFRTLRKPLADKFFNSEPYAGFYPVSTEYIKINVTDENEPDSRFGLTPMGVLGYTLIFWNKVSLDMHAGFGISFRLGGRAGKQIEPSAVAGVALGVRL